MSYERTWSGDWHSRLLERVREQGFETVTEYANHRAGASLLTLADELGPEDIAGAQIQSALLDEAIRTNTVPRLLRDLFVRQLRHRLPQGWTRPLDERSRYKVASAFAGWASELKEHVDDDASSAAARAFLDADFPAGWLPEGPEDPVIVAFVDRCLGRAPS